MKVGKWSTTAANNNAAPPDGWPENQAPSTVNDCARENMAAIRTLVSDLQFVDLGHTPSFLTATTFSLGTADIVNFQVGRRIKLFDATTHYGYIDSVSATFVSVRLDGNGGDALTSSLSSVALGVISNRTNALPEAAHTQHNVVINGDLDVWQRNTFFGGVSNFQYTADRFMYEQNMGVTGSVVQKQRASSGTSIPTIAQAGRLINNALAFVVTATQSVLLAGQFSMISYIVEGYDWRPIAHQPLGLGFWACTNKPGVYSLAMRSGLVSASYVTSFTLSAVDTPTYFFVQLPEAPESPYTWDYSTGPGLRLSWVLAAGTGVMATNQNAWTATNVVACSSQVNLFEEEFNEFIVTGITLKRGWADVPLATRRYAEELELCHRYYWRGLPCAGINGSTSNFGDVLSWPVAFPATMRDVPTMTSFLPSTVATFLTAQTADAATVNGFRLIAIATAANGNCNLAFDDGTDYFDASAEL